MTCECCQSAAEHAADEAQAKAVYLPLWEAEKRQGLVEHCPDCVEEARGQLVAEYCRTQPPGHGVHRACEFHR